MLDPKLDVRLLASRVTHDVVDAFLENQKDLTTNIRAKFHVPGFGLLKAKLNIARSEELAGESPHALGEIAEMVLAGINRPNDIAHRIHQFARRTGDLSERLCHRRIISLHAATHDFAEQRNVR